MALTVEELEVKVEMMGEGDEVVLSEIFDKMGVPGDKPMTARRFKRAILDYLATLPANQIAAWQKPEPRLENVLAKLENVKPVDEAAIAEKVMEQVVARRGEIGLVDPKTLKSLTREVMEELKAETAAHPIDTEALRKVLEEFEAEKAKKSPAPAPAPAPTPAPAPKAPVVKPTTPDPTKDLKGWLAWAKTQSETPEMKALIKAGEDALKTPSKKDDENVLRRIVNWKPFGGKK